MKKYIALFFLLASFSSIAHAQSEPPYGMSELEAYSIFYDNYRQGEYDMALQFGGWMLEKKPRTIEGYGNFELSKQYDRMKRIFTELAEEESDPALKESYLDSALFVMDDALETFSDEEIDKYEWRFEKGQFYQRYSSSIDGGMDKALEIYEQLFQEDPERFTEAADGYYARLLLNEYVNSEDRENALAMIETIEPIGGEEVKKAIREAQDEIFSDPVERIEFLEGELANSPDNEEILIELADLYERQDMRGKAIETAQKLYELNPNFENTKKLADYAKADAQYELANRYLKEALDKTDDNREMRDITLEIANTHQNLDQFQEARRFARRAIDLDPNWGEPYLTIASIYAQTVSQCTENRKIDRDDRRVYWLVMDYLDKARQADSSVENKVQNQYNTYEPVAPTTQDKFFRGWEEGNEISIDGSKHECYSWINESTRVR